MPSPNHPTVSVRRAVPAALVLAAAASAVPAVTANAQRVTATPQHKQLRPSNTAAVTLAVAPKTTDYVIQAGDTLGALARHHGITVQQLQSLNGLSSNRIYAGEHLKVPASGAAVVTAPATTKPTSTNTKTVVAGPKYTIRDGDTLTGIAKRHGVTVAQLRQVNPELAQSSRIRAGNQLTLPTTQQPQKANQQKANQQTKIGNTFAGRTYAPELVAAAQANKDALHQRKVPSRKAMQRMIASTAQQHGVDPKLAQAIAYQESGFNMRAVSPANAVGVMQVIPSTVKWTSQMAGRDLNALHPQDNVTAGVLLIKANLNATDGDVNTAIAAYYQGLRSVNQNGPYADTVAYVNSVTTLMGRF